MEMMQQLAAIAVVLALLAGALWCLRRRGLANLAFPGHRPGRSLESLEHVVLGPQHILHLVRFQDRLLLLAASPNGCSVLDQSPLERADDPSRREVSR